MKLNRFTISEIALILAAQAVATIEVVLIVALIRGWG